MELEKKLQCCKAACVVFLAACICLAIARGIDQLRLAFALDQVNIFAAMQKQALDGDTDDAVECLRYTLSYYPSGTKQKHGSRLDRIVEQSRQQAISLIIKTLEVKSGEQRGSDPNAWLGNVVEKGNDQTEENSD